MTDNVKKIQLDELDALGLLHLALSHIQSIAYSH